jgi:hypothetical protein
MAYDNEIPIPDKFLMPDGSIVTFAGAEYAPADEDRATLYLQKQYQAAKWLLPDGSIVSGIPMDMEAFEAIFVPKTTEINGHPLSGDITLTADDIGIPDALVYKGTIDCSANPDYPAADAGHMYMVSVAGKIGGASGSVVVAGDSILCNTDGTAAGTQAAVGASWNIIQNNIDLTNITISGGTINGTTVGLTTATTIRSLFDEDTLITTGNISANQASGGVINNYEQTADCAMTWPTIVEGQSCVFCCATTVDKYWRVVAPAGMYIWLDGVKGSAAGYVGIASATEGACFQIVSVKNTGGTYDLMATTISGTIVAG